MAYSLSSKGYLELLDDIHLIRQLRSEGSSIDELRITWDVHYSLMNFFIVHHKLEIVIYPGLKIATLDKIRHGETPLNGETYCLVRKRRIPYILTPVHKYKELVEAANLKGERND